MKTTKVPEVLLVMKPVDGGRAMIGLIECPNCGQDHFTTHLECGERLVFCGTGHATDSPNIGSDGYSRVDVIQIV